MDMVKFSLFLQEAIGGSKVSQYPISVTNEKA